MKPILSVLSLVLLLPSVARADDQPYRPNIVMIVVHDLGQHLGCYGVPSVQTPNIDRLAAEGVRFQNIFSTAGVCSPGRASLHTGRYGQSNGLMGLTHSPWWWSLNDDEVHTAQYLGQLGYDTCLVGMNHLGQSPERLGYDQFLSRSRRAAESVEATAKLFQSRTPDSPPLFVKIGFNEAHRPFDYGDDTEQGVYVPPWLQDTPQVRADLAAYQGEIRYFDQQVGGIMEAVRTSPVADDTLIILTGEHGIPHVGAKWTVRKPGIEIALIMNQPGTVFSGGQVYDHLISNVDILPTLLDFLGAPIPERIEGVSHKSRIEDTSTPAPRREAFAQFTPAMKRDNESRCVITDTYHLIWYCDAGRTLKYPVDVEPKAFAAHQARAASSGTRPFFQLYDIVADPYELNDLGSKPEHADTVADLSARLLAWMKDVDDPLLRGPLASPYYLRAVEKLLESQPE